MLRRYRYAIAAGGMAGLALTLALLGQVEESMLVPIGFVAGAINGLAIYLLWTKERRK